MLSFANGPLCAMAVLIGEGVGGVERVEWGQEGTKLGGRGWEDGQIRSKKGADLAAATKSKLLHRLDPEARLHPCLRMPSVLISAVNFKAVLLVIPSHRNQNCGTPSQDLHLDLHLDLHSPLGNKLTTLWRCCLFICVRAYVCTFVLTYL